VKTKDLIHKNVVFFARYFKLVAIAILISVAVIVGSLVIGDSVRSSLVNRVNERLGNTETVIFARQSFLSEAFSKHPVFESSARGILLTDGFISHNGTLLPVMVWGVDDRNITKGNALINHPLFNELNLPSESTLVLRLPAQGLVPSGSLFVTENYTTSLRLNSNGVVDVQDGGNISLKNEQSLPLNIFVNRDELAEEMKVEGKINLVLADQKIAHADIEKAWNFKSSGLNIKPQKNFTEVTSDRVFLQEEVIESITANNAGSNRMFSYLANSIANKSTSIPYSFVTAVDKYKTEILQKDEVILSDYTAKRLNARVDDDVYISFFISQDFKTLKTDSVFLRVKKIVPLDELMADSTLSADFPGISDVERCTEWDSDLTIDMDLITSEDEKYWELYRSTPKAILPYEAVADKWGNEYGNATSIRLSDTSPNLSALTPEMFNIQEFYPREAGIHAAKNGVDFAGLFMALGFFIILSAMLLMVIPISEMMIQRKGELDLLKAMGYTKRRIRMLLWSESAPVALVSSLIGVVVGIIYTALVMWLLGSFWKGATHTEGFTIYPHWLTLFTGFIVGIFISLVTLRIVISHHLKEKRKNRRPQKNRITRKKWTLIIVALITASLAFYNLFVITSVELFAIVGVMLMATFAFWGDYIICHKGEASTKLFNDDKLIFRTLFANRKQALLSYFSLAFGVFIVFSVGLNRQSFSNSSQLEKATGGYSLWCETSIPVYHNINTQQGREKLNLQGLPQQTKILQCLKFSADEASCLNLNRVSTPSVLGVDLQNLLQGPLEVQNNIFSQQGDALLKQLKTSHNGVIPALVDATVLQWSLAKNLGDTIYYTGTNGQELAIQLVGTLPNTIFQGYILIDQKLFSQAWVNTTGSELFLMNVDSENTSKVKTLVSQALYEYGLRLTTTNERLKQFNSVTDTYLTIFMTLGGIGLLLGIFGFVIVIRKNLSIRQKEIELYSMLGFQHPKIKNILYRENRIVPLFAIITGLISALVGIGTHYINVSRGVWLTALIFAVLFIVLTIAFVKRIVKQEI
jgi:putative ABC transport system permease protein